MAMEGENTDVKSFFSTEYDQSQLPDMLKIYYTWIFPYKEYYQWLAYDKESFTHREFSFTLQDDIYVRYQSFDDQHELKECVKKSLPYKIDIGAMFNYKPKLNKSLNPGSFKAESKELVFDIDMTDYDDIRTCCSEANMCNKCWIYMKIAIKIIDRALEEDFGYSHRLWVYSGRRGVHCWVCDKEARQLSQSSRNSIAEYLTIIKGNEELTNKVNISSKQPLHPFVINSLAVIDIYFEQLFNDQEYLASPESCSKILSLISKVTREKLEAEWAETSPVSSKKWSRLLSEATVHEVRKIKLQYSYPRLDVNVTKGLNHLLKSPLCIHPKTGRVCVPIDVDKIDIFDPFNVPTINTICREFESHKDNKKGYAATSLAPYMVTFCNFVTRLSKQRDHKSMEF